MKRRILPLAVIAVLLVTVFTGLGSRADKAFAKEKAKPKQNNAKAAGFNLQNLIAAPINAIAREFEQRQKIDRANAKILAQNEANIKQMIPQYVQVFRPALSSELAFIRLTCDLPKEYRPRVKAAGEASLESAARKYAESQYLQGRNRGRWTDRQSEPRQIICDALAKSLQESLTPEQLAKYNTEVAHRMASRKRAAILWAVSQLDETLSLTGEQRDKIFDSISNNWQERWEQWLMMYQYAGQYFPTIPDQFVSSHLNDEQKEIWNGLQKVDFGFSIQDQGQIPDDDDWWGAEATNPVPLDLQPVPPPAYAEP